MNIDGYLIVRKGKNWNGNNCRFVKKKPALESNEISVKVDLIIPDELFTRPQLKFRIAIPKEAVPQQEISAEVVGNVQELIQKNLGIDIKLVAPESEY